MKDLKRCPARNYSGELEELFHCHLMAGHDGAHEGLVVVNHSWEEPREDFRTAVEGPAIILEPGELHP